MDVLQTHKAVMQLSFNNKRTVIRQQCEVAVHTRKLSFTLVLAHAQQEATPASPPSLAWWNGTSSTTEAGSETEHQRERDEMDFCLSDR